jgi:type I restriction enzyme M protein
MAAIGNFFLIPPDLWLFHTHGDVTEGKRRAGEYFKAYGTYEGAEYQIEEFVRRWVVTQLLKAYN